MRIRSCTLPLLLGGLMACTPQGAPVDVEAAQAALRDADAQYTRTGVEKDLEGFVALYAPDATMYAPDTPAATGLDAIRGVAESFMADPAFSGSFTPLAIEVSAGGDMGYTLNMAELTVTGPDGQPVTERLRDFHIWRKQADGSWKVVVDIWNAEPPATSPSN